MTNNITKQEIIDLINKLKSINSYIEEGLLYDDENKAIEIIEAAFDKGRREGLEEAEELLKGETYSFYLWKLANSIRALAEKK